MKLLVTGSRKCEDKDYELFETWLNKVLIEHEIEVSLMIHGGAYGADQFADKWAKARHILAKVVRPDYQKYNPKSAPLIRNLEMLEKCDVCVAVVRIVTGKQIGRAHV